MKYNTKKRVRAGMAWLDENRPNWINQIDTDTLKVSQGFQCPLGQTGGGYYSIRDEKGAEWVVSHGFDAHGRHVEDLHFLDVEFTKLTNRWIKEINKRKELVNAPKAGEEASEAHGEA